MKRWVLSLLVCLLSLLFAGCNADFMTTPAARPTPTLLPPYIQTPQAAQADAQATLAFGEAQKAQMDITATALAVERAALNLQLTQAAATEVYFTSQTEAANRAATSTVEYIQAQQTEQAIQTADSAATAAAARVATQNAETHATETAVVLQIIQASAEAEVKRIQDEQATQNLRTWAVRIFVGSVAVSLFVLVLFTLVQFRRLIVSRMLLFRYGAKGRGKPYLPVLQRDGSIKVTDPGKSASAVIDIPAEGEAQIQAGLDDPQLQTYIAVQAAITDMLLALNMTTTEHRLPWEKDVPSNVSPERKKERSAIAATLLQQAVQQRAQLSSQQAGTRYLPSEIVDTQFREATEEDRDVAGWLGDVESKLLD